MIIKFNSLIKTNAKLRLFSQMLLKKLKKKCSKPMEYAHFLRILTLYTRKMCAHTENKQDLFCVCTQS